MDQTSEPRQHPASLIDRYSAYFYDPPQDDAQHWNPRSRAKVLVVACHLGALLIVVAIGSRALAGALPSLDYVAVVSLLGLTLIFAPFVLKGTLSVQRAALLPLGAIGLVMPVMLAKTGGLDAPSMMILPALPLIAAFFAGFRIALAFTTLLAVESAGLALSTHFGWVHPFHSPPALRAMLAVAYISATAAIARIYELERQDVETRLRAMAAALYDATIRDPLTNLLNRRFFDERLESEVAFTRRHRSPISLLALDVDHFKHVNDAYGHAAGDTVLVEIAEILRAGVRQEDTVARIGGEEFVVLLRQTDTVGAQIVAERLRATIAAHSFAVGAERVTVTASIGCATTMGAGAEAKTLLSRADARMYVAKRAGRNRVVGEPAAARLSA